MKKLFKTQYFELLFFFEIFTKKKIINTLITILLFYRISSIHMCS